MELNKEYVQRFVSAQSDKQLIGILEMGVPHYHPLAIELAEAELEERKLLPETQLSLVNEWWKQRLSANLKEILKQDEPLESQFLSQDELVALVKQEVAAWFDKKELLSIDTTKYWAAVL